MDASQITTRATTALSTLMTTLSTLEAQQAALLQSMSLTHSTLQTLPAYSAVAPTLSQIPTYSSKLARLKRLMALQQQELEGLKRRALDVGKRRREHLARVREREREEAEKDRGVLRARIVGEGLSRAGTPVSGEMLEENGSAGILPASGRGTPASGRGTPASGRGTPASGRGTPASGRGTPASGRGTPVPAQAVRVVKKKKARKVEIQ
ncbi:hypothetical protein BZA05DRAFT_168494 [Tricharina praecox]|uniref:uncharacterized protein n=1 Tax=Tricharina praecox TaxID=43433 RepID=UPI002220BB3D|nr:uncharacterized protein BZA05DRAFT_168494 [Tricharina praecox]KAI5857210.1 hypothetical protein BZA05DRAFT_168494 [Tricharina praecox]